jgi:hypothetical protein
MGNLANTVNLFTGRIDKGNINKSSMLCILEQDGDFKGVKGVNASKIIFDKWKYVEDESERVEMMVSALFLVNGFVGSSTAYGIYKSQIIETEFEYIIIIAVVV